MSRLTDLTRSLAYAEMVLKSDHEPSINELDNHVKERLRRILGSIANKLKEPVSPRVRRSENLQLTGPTRAQVRVYEGARWKMVSMQQQAQEFILHRCTIGGLRWGRLGGDSTYTRQVMNVAEAGDRREDPFQDPEDCEIGETRANAEGGRAYGLDWSRHQMNTWLGVWSHPGSDRVPEGHALATQGIMRGTPCIPSTAHRVSCREDGVGHGEETQEVRQADAA